MLWIGIFIGTVIGVSVMAILNSNRYYAEKEENKNAEDKIL